MASQYTYDEQTVSDLHKDAYGFRPSSSWWSVWNAMSRDEKQAQWDHLITAMEASIQQEKMEAAYAVENFNHCVTETIRYGAVDEETALRWMTGSEHMFSSQDIEQWVWGHGILFTDRGREVVEKLKKIHRVD